MLKSSDSTVPMSTALAILITLLFIIFVLVLVIIYTVRRRLHLSRARSKMVYSVSRLNSRPPSEPVKIDAHNGPIPMIDTGGYQLVPGEEEQHSVQAVAPPFRTSTPEVSTASASKHLPSTASYGARQSRENAGRFPIYASVAIEQGKSDEPTIQVADGAPYAESVVQRPPSVSSVEIAPPSLPKRLGSVSSVSTVETHDLSSPEFNLYDDPVECRSLPESDSDQHVREAKTKTKIYEEPSIRPERMLASSDTSSSSGKKLKPLNPIYEEPPPLQRGDGPTEISSLQLDRKKKIGEGQFGDVFLAIMYFRSEGEHGPGKPPRPVALKFLKSSAGTELVNDFKKEVKFMSCLQHPHVIRLLGVCSKGQPCMVLEHMENGDLNAYLNKCKLSIGGQDTADGVCDHRVTFRDLLLMAQHVASGMEYMSEHAFVHRDLAARNCLVDREGCVKICDFGLSRHLYEKGYYRVHGAAVLPIRWMAPESFYGHFSIQSDVFSFGITMWEVITLCRQIPLDHLTDNEIIQMAIRSVNTDSELSPRPQHSLPVYCSAEVEQLLHSCWEKNPADRPTFSELNADLQKMLQSSTA